jgi:hypothetical protein
MWKALLLATLAAAAGAACAPAEAKPAPVGHDRTFTIEGHEVTIPGAWRLCRESAECEWVVASCADAELGVSKRHAEEARRRFRRACARSNMHMIGLSHDDPPPCEREFCGGPEFGPGELAFPDAGRRRR